MKHLIESQAILVVFWTNTIYNYLLFLQLSNPNMPRVIYTSIHLLCTTIPLSPLSQKPSWRHATLESWLPQASSVTVPHTPPTQTSTRPELGDVVPASLISSFYTGASDISQRHTERERERERERETERDREKDGESLVIVDTSTGKIYISTDNF